MGGEELHTANTSAHTKLYHIGDSTGAIGSFVISDIAVAEVITHFTSMCQMQKQSTKCFVFSFNKEVNKVLIYVALDNEGKILCSLFLPRSFALIASWKVHYMKGKHMKV